MKKIGFIDLFIDEWHANNYPAWFRKAARGKEYTVAMAWEERPAAKGRALTQWCREMDITPAASIEQVVEDCDALCVLAPSNPEVHERLADLPLRSGKPVYIDKPFAPDRQTAEKLFALAARHGTPLMSSSALRYASELIQAQRDIAAAGQRIQFAGAGGGGSSFAEYGIHQIEMIVSLLGLGAEQVMQCGNGSTDHLVIAYPDNRGATVTLNPAMPFTVSACTEDNRHHALTKLSDFFPNLIDAILEFFATGKSPIPPEQTIEITGIVAAGIRAAATRGQWVSV